jgi:hypothetical protein
MITQIIQRSLKLLPLFLITAASTFGQGAPTLQQHADRSRCSNIVALAGNVNLNCSSLTPAQKKILDSIPALLNKILSNQLNSDAIMQKLDEILKAQTAPATVNSCPNGICISGGSVEHPEVNNFGEKQPSIVDFEPVTSSSPAVELPDFGVVGHPVTSFKFYITTPWNAPQFLAICDRPCHAYDVRRAKPSGVMMLPNFRSGSLPGEPNYALFVVDIRPFQTYTYYLFSVVSDDTEPAKILSFAPSVAALMPQ